MPSIVKPAPQAADERPHKETVSTPEPAAPRETRVLTAARAWRVLLVVAVSLALASIGLSVAAILGAQI